MKTLSLTFLLFVALYVSGCSQSKQPNEPNLQSNSVLGVFVASSPCGDMTNTVLNIPSGTDCEFIKWNLTLYQNEGTHAPSTFILNCMYGLTKPGTPDFMGGGTSVSIQGKWTITKGTKTNPNAVVYQLDMEKPLRSVSLVKLDDNLLHLLYHDKTLLIGNGGWSYTLSKSGN